LKPIVLKFFAHFFEIIDFAVIADLKSTAGRGHGLVAFAGEILDRKTFVPQGYPRFCISPDSTIIRPTMNKSISHLLRNGLHPFLGGRAMRIEKAADSTHSERFLSNSRDVWVHDGSKAWR
jgi:hypothetical protein